MGSVSCCSVFMVPGAGGSARRACRARESSPNRVSWTARCALWSVDGSRGWGGVVSDGCGRCRLVRLLWMRSCHCPRKKAVNLASSAGFGILDVPGGLWSSMRGKNIHNFHALSCCTASDVGVCRIWLRLKCMALLMGPRRKDGGERKVGQC